MSFNSDTNILDLQSITVKSQNEKIEIPVQNSYQTSSRRWLILFAFSMISIINLFNLNEYFDIEEAMKTFYGKNFSPFDNLKKKDTNYWQEMFNLVCYGLFIFPAMFLVQLKGIWYSCLLGSLLTLFGCGLKCVSIRSELYLFLIIGQILCAIAQAFIQTPLVKISSNWFGANETATATAVLYFYFFVFYFFKYF